MKAQKWLEILVHVVLASAPRRAPAGRAQAGPPTDSHDHVSYMPLLVSFPNSHCTCAKCGNETLAG